MRAFQVLSFVLLLLQVIIMIASIDTADPCSTWRWRRRVRCRSHDCLLVNFVTIVNNTTTFDIYLY